MNPWSWTVVALGILLVVPFALWELRHDDPLIDVRMFRSPALGPVFLTAGLFGVSVLGAQAPLSTFARTDPNEYGYGLGTTGFATSLIIGIYLIAMIVGALLFPLIARLTAPRLTLMGASTLVGIGFLLFLPFHDSYVQVIVNMVIVGLGSGALVAALPAAAASAAPPTQTGVATGLTNSVKTVGGAIASCVFGIALLNGATGAASASEGTAGSLSGYFTVWIVCGVTALIAAVRTGLRAEDRVHRPRRDRGGHRAGGALDVRAGISRRGGSWSASRARPRACPDARAGSGACPTRACPWRPRSRPSRGHPRSRA